MCDSVCVSLCTTVVHNTSQSNSVYLPSYPPDKHQSSDAVYWRGGGTDNRPGKTLVHALIAEPSALRACLHGTPRAWCAILEPVITIYLYKKCRSRIKCGCCRKCSADMRSVCVIRSATADKISTDLLLRAKVHRR